MIELFHHANALSLSEKDEIESYKQKLYTIFEAKTKKEKMTPISISLYSCNFMTTQMLIGDGTNASNLNESVGVNVHVRDECFERLRNIVFSDRFGLSSLIISYNNSFN